MQSKRLSLISNSPFHINQAFLFGSEDPDEEDPSDDVENGNPDGGAGGDDSSDGRDPQKKIRALQEETNRHFELRRQAEEERDQLRQWKEEQDRKSRTEVENLQKDLADRDQRITALTEANKKLVVKNAFLQEQDYTWHNPERALSSVDLSGVEVNEDGTVKNPDTLKSAIKKLAEDEPYMLKTKDKEEAPPNPRSTGNPPKPGNSQKPTREKVMEGLKSKYPALRTRG